MHIDSKHRESAGLIRLSELTVCEDHNRQQIPGNDAGGRQVVATASPLQDLQGPSPAKRKNTGWDIAAAALFIVLGIFAIIEPAVAALAVSRLVGWLLVFGGLLYLIGAATGRGVKEVIFQVAIGIIYLVGGRYSLTHPRLAMGALTLLLGTVSMAGGVAEIVSYLRLKSADASKWMLFNGIITFFLGGMIWFHWPSSSVRAIGILVGLTLLMTGVTRLMFAFTARKLSRLEAR
jgi:uncharacterized membrane protein HdeD (DUF308 family)